MTPDAINGAIEAGGALFLLVNIRRLLVDRSVSGVHWLPTAYWTLWGCWNLFYYPSLGQWMSFAGGCAVVVVNLAWVALVFYFRRHSAAIAATPAIAGEGAE